MGHLDPMGRPCNVRSRTTVRLDRQPNAGSGEHVCANLQVQVNAAAGVPPGQGTTIGQVLVPALVYAVANQPGPARESLRSQLLDVVRSALNRSVAGRGA